MVQLTIDLGSVFPDEFTAHAAMIADSEEISPRYPCRIRRDGESWRALDGLELQPTIELTANEAAVRFFRAHDGGDYWFDMGPLEIIAERTSQGPLKFFE